jgi:hypothetical protein
MNMKPLSVAWAEKKVVTSSPSDAEAEGVGGEVGFAGVP